jgi:hypothetical protein
MQMMWRLFFFIHPYLHLGLSTTAWTLAVRHCIPWLHAPLHTTIGLPLPVMDYYYLLTRIVWHDLGRPGLAQTPMLLFVALLSQPLWPGSLQT